MSRCKACDAPLTDVELRRRTPTDLCGPCDDISTAAAEGVFVERPWSAYRPANGKRNSSEDQ